MAAEETARRWREWRDTYAGPSREAYDKDGIWVEEQWADGAYLNALEHDRDELVALRAVWSDTHPPQPPTRALWDETLATIANLRDQIAALTQERDEARDESEARREIIRRLSEMANTPEIRAAAKKELEGEPHGRAINWP